MIFTVENKACQNQVISMSTVTPMKTIMHNMIISSNMHIHAYVEYSCRLNIVSTSLCFCHVLKNGLSEVKVWDAFSLLLY